MTQYEGQCLCGAVEFTVEVPKPEVDCCHCSMCQRWAAGPAMMVHVGTPQIKDASALGTYDSSDWAQRQFCTKCGTSLFYRLKDGSFTALPLPVLKNAKGFAFNTEIFIEEKPEYYDFAGERKRMTGAEVFAAFAGDA